MTRKQIRKPKHNDFLKSCNEIMCMNYFTTKLFSTNKPLNLVSRRLMRLRTLACHYRALVGPKPILTARQLIDPGQT